MSQELMSQFHGFTQNDFDVFLIPEFHDRMTALRMNVRPKLAQLGEDLAPKLSRLLDQPIFPHTASHARRRVNPPDDTWVAFSRSHRGYKRYAHFEVGIALDSIFVRFVIKPEGVDDKPSLIRHLQQEGLASFRLRNLETISWYRDDHGQDPLPISQIDDETLLRIIHHTELKSRGFAVGITIDRTNPVVHKPELVDRSYDAIVDMAPLYFGTLSKSLEPTR